MYKKACYSHRAHPVLNPPSLPLRRCRRQGKMPIAGPQGHQRLPFVPPQTQAEYPQKKPPWKMPRDLAAEDWAA